MNSDSTTSHSGKRRTAKMEATLARLKRRLGEEKGRFRSDDEAAVLCVVKLDRYQMVCSQDPTAALRGIPGYQPQPNRFPRQKGDGRFQPYGCSQWFWNMKSQMKFYIESDKREGWLSPYRVTLVADDQTGLTPEEVFGILEVLPEFKLTMLEVAFDFHPEFLGLRDARFHLLFGKARPRPRVNGNFYWGTRKGIKRVQIYFKKEVNRVRVELELRSRFLRRFGIADPFDFGRLLSILPGRHIFFARLDRQKLIRQLRTTGIPEGYVRGVLRDVDAMSGDLWPSLNYLRNEVGIKNTRRLAVPLEANGLVRDALRVWVSQWPKGPTRLAERRHLRGSAGRRARVEITGTS